MHLTDGSCAVFCAPETFRPTLPHPLHLRGSPRGEVRGEPCLHLQHLPRVLHGYGTATLPSDILSLKLAMVIRALVAPAASSSQHRTQGHGACTRYHQHRSALTAYVRKSFLLPLAACAHRALLTSTRSAGSPRKPSSFPRSPRSPRAPGCPRLTVRAEDSSGAVALARGCRRFPCSRRCPTRGASSCIFQGDRCSQAPCRHNDCIGRDAETGWVNDSESGVIVRALGKPGIIYNLTYNLLLEPSGLKWLDVSVPLEKGAGWEKEQHSFSQLQNPECLKSSSLRF